MQNSIFLQTFLKMAPICQLPWTYSKHLVPFSPLRVAYRAGQIVRPRIKIKMDISLLQVGYLRLHSTNIDPVYREETYMEAIQLLPHTSPSLILS